MINTYTCERCGKTNVYKNTYAANDILIKEERDITYFSYQHASYSSVKDNEIYIYDNEEYVRPISYSYKEMRRENYIHMLLLILTMMMIHVMSLK